MWASLSKGRPVCCEARRKPFVSAFSVVARRMIREFDSGFQDEANDMSICNESIDVMTALHRAAKDTNDMVAPKRKADERGHVRIHRSACSHNEMSCSGSGAEPRLSELRSSRHPGAGIGARLNPRRSKSTRIEEIKRRQTFH